MQCLSQEDSVAFASFIFSGSKAAMPDCILAASIRFSIGEESDDLAS